MRRVQLVVTGRCEQALHTSLQRVFPELIWPEPVLVDPITSTSLAAPPPAGLMRTIDKFVLRLAELVDDCDETLVIGIDDLEDNQPAHVADALRGAIDRVLADERIARSDPLRERVARKLQERCSFHLLRPMVEAYFFADPAALRRAGARRSSRFDPTSRDLEFFEVDDLEFTEPSDSSEKDDWRRGGPNRRRHPKRYLKFLTSDERGVWSYRESRDGRAALSGLEWDRVLMSPQWATAARSLFNDVLDFVEGAPRNGSELPETSRSAPRRTRLLRNL